MFTGGRALKILPIGALTLLCWPWGAIALAQPGIQITPQGDAELFERPNPATVEDLLISPGRTPTVKPGADMATIYAEISSTRPLTIEAKVISGPALLNDASPKLLNPGQTVPVRAVARPGNIVIGLFDGEKLVRVIEYEIRQEKRIRQSIRASVRANQQIRDGQPESVDPSFSAGYSIRPNAGRWRVSAGANWSPGSSRSFNVTGSYDF